MSLGLLQNEHNEKMLAILKGGGRFPHCMIISGAKGTGKTSFATEIAAVYYCEQSDYYCGVCDSCRAVLSGNHPDVSVVMALEESKSGAITIEQIREVKKSSTLYSSTGKAKIYIIENAHLMLEGAQNALLKQIEEPASSVIYILVSESEQMLLETVRSRATLLKTPSLTTEQCKTAVMRKISTADEQLVENLSSIYSNVVGEVISALEDKQTIGILEDCEKIYSAILDLDDFGVLTILKQYDGKREQFVRFLTMLKMYIFSKAKGEAKISRLSLIRIVEAISDAITKANQYVAPSLLSSILAYSLVNN